MKLEFKINKYYLLIHILKQSELSFPEWEKFQNKLCKLWEKNPEGYYLFSWYSEAIFIRRKSLLKLDNTLKEAKKLIQEVLRLEDFQRLYEETKKYLPFVENQWQRNKKEALRILEELSGLKLPDKTITVFITHPKLRNGVNFPLFNAIGWGHSEDWQNYSTVYLAHELMHILTFKKTKNEKVMHALIELMTDNELRIRFNKKGGRYFKEGKFGVGHPSLRNLERKILPYWKKYLKRKEKNIFEFEKEIIKKIKRGADK